MEIIHTPEEMRCYANELRAQGRKIGFVPTMGYFHEGHLALMRECNKHVDDLIVSIFVNPAQFNDPEDFENYPRNDEADLAECEKLEASAVFFPTREAMYPSGYLTYVNVTKITDNLCGQSRPGHFQGVATICTKLFNIIRPDITVFGQKDFQQLALIRTLIRDLNFPIRLIGHPTIREEDGLAMSSRNARLNDEQRKRARGLSEALFKAREAADAGERDAQKLVNIARDILLKRNVGEIDYISVVDAERLALVDTIEKKAVMALAAYVGPVHLIDNLPMNYDETLW